VLVSPVTLESVMFTVPVSPSTLSWAPGQASSPARVTTNEGIAKAVNHEP
jgi:hypothetical protein